MKPKVCCHYSSQNPLNFLMHSSQILTKNQFHLLPTSVGTLSKENGIGKQEYKKFDMWETKIITSLDFKH